MSESPTPTGTPLPWTKLSSRHDPSLLLFRPRWDKLVNPRTQQPMERLVLETPDWVNVVALTEDEQLILVQQYRFGTSTVTTEIPGGMVDRGEAHADAAQRELREETGYAARTWTYLGAVEPNPAFHDNLCHHWLATGCHKVSEHLELDAGEDIVVYTEELTRVAERVRAGEIRHVLVLSALQKVIDLYDTTARRRNHGPHAD